MSTKYGIYVYMYVALSSLVQRKCCLIMKKRGGPDNAMARKHKTKLQTIMNKETTQKLTIDQYVPD
jgi:hypothetical protein